MDLISEAGGTLLNYSQSVVLLAASLSLQCCQQTVIFFWVNAHTRAQAHTPFVLVKSFVSERCIV